MLDNNTATPAGDGAMSRESLAGLFAAELAAESNPPKEETPAEAAPVDTVEPAAPAEAAAEYDTADEAVTTAEADPAIEPETATESTAIAAPSGMSEADKAHFDALTPELKSWISKTKSEADKAFTQKSMEVAEARKRTDAEFDALSGAMQQYDAILARFTDTPLAPPDPALRDSDPFEFDRQMANYVSSKHQAEVAAQERARNAQAHGQLQQRQRAEWVKAETAALKELAPDLIDASPKGRQLREGVWSYARESGYTNEQLSMASARDMSTLLKAMRYDAAQKARASAKPAAKPAPIVASPGPSKAAGGRPSNVARAVETVASTGTRDSLAAAYLAQIRSEKR